MNFKTARRELSRLAKGKFRSLSYEMKLWPPFNCDKQEYDESKKVLNQK